MPEHIPSSETSFPPLSGLDLVTGCMDADVKIVKAMLSVQETVQNMLKNLLK
jgi:hypothetical protein